MKYVVIKQSMRNSHTLNGANDRKKLLTIIGKGKGKGKVFNEFNC